jgi:uncharacterized membrane protein
VLAGLTLSLGALATFFVAAGIMHFVNPGFYLAMMPKLIPSSWHGPLVALTGVCEILGGLGLLPAATRTLTGWCLLVFLVAVLPANVQMLLNALARHASTGTLAALWIRLPIQFLLDVVGLAGVARRKLRHLIRHSGERNACPRPSAAGD